MLRTQRSGCGLLALESILDVFAGLLHIGLCLVALAVGFHAVVAGDLSEAFLDLAAEFFALVLHLVICTHIRDPLSDRPPGHPKSDQRVISLLENPCGIS